MTLDRINNDGHYVPENCRWATKHQQQQNRRNTVRVTDEDGQSTPLSAFAIKHGVNYYRLHRLVSSGVSAVDALAELRHA
jgi:hypothetical protein